jgi:hypothetical protein
VARYLCSVAEELLSRPLDLPAGFRFVEAGPLEFARLERTVVVDDEGAPAELAGKLIEPIFHEDYETGEVTIVERRIVSPL